MNPPYITAPQGEFEEEVKDGTNMNRIPDPKMKPLNESHANLTLEDNQNNQHNDSDDNFSDDPKSRTSASSRVNFSKLTAEEKERRCHNISKEVKQLRRKIRNMEERLVRANNGEVVHSSERGSGISEVSILNAKDKLETYKGFELSDQKDLIDNLCNVIIKEKLKPDSLAYYMICTLVRGYISDDEWKRRYESVDMPETDNGNNDMLKNKEIIVTFPEKDVRISKKEYEVFSQFQENEKVMRLLTGQLSSLEKDSDSPPNFVGFA